MNCADGRSKMQLGVRNGSPSATCCPHCAGAGSSASFVKVSVTVKIGEPDSSVTTFSTKNGVLTARTQNFAETRSGLSSTTCASHGIRFVSLCCPISAPI